MFVFVESTVFARYREAYLDDEEYTALQQFMLQQPEAGKLVPGSGGVRKLRWSRESGGKRGGLRVVYYVRYAPNEFWMLTLYAKRRLATIPGHLLRELKKEFGNG